MTGVQTCALPIYLVEDGDYITFRETRFKRKWVDSLVNRVWCFNAGRLPILHTCLRQYKALRATHFAPEPPSPFFWQLHAEGNPSTALICQIFDYATTTWRHLFPLCATHHALGRGGATSAHSIGVPLEIICFWGGWSFGSDSVYKYIDFSHEPSPVDVRFFGWMVDRASEIDAGFLHRDSPSPPSP